MSLSKTMYKRIVVLVLCLLYSFAIFAQEISVQAPSVVAVGQRFQVTFEVNGNAKDFHAPTFKGLSVLSGPNRSSSTSMSIINGNVSRSVSNGFSYVIGADMEGTFTIGPASCTVDGKKISSNSFTIKVEKGNPQQQQQAQQQRGWGAPSHQQQPQQQQATEIDGKSLFARASINKSNPYQGEQIIITYKIYTRVPISQFQIDKLPGNKGFWAEDLSEGRKIKQYEETLNGMTYQVAEIRRGALFAQENGKLTISPLDLDVLAMVQRQRRRSNSIWDLFDDAFFNPTQAVEKHLRTNSLNVNVRPLPAAPDGYCGGVGNFDAKGDVDTRTVKANEAITYHVTISGSGNLMLINEPTPDFPSTFEVYDPQVNDKINRTDGGVSGSRTFEWIVIPRSQGDYEIPAFNFVYFDPQKGSYVTKQVPAIPLHVEKGDPNAMKNVSSNQSDVKLLNSDINYVKSNTSLQRKDATSVPYWFWIALAAIILASIVAMVIGLKKQQAQQDIAGTRLRRATKEARRRLKNAEKHLRSGDDNKFYEEIYKAIWGCLSDKFNINLAQLSSDTVRQNLEEKQVAEEQKTQILQTLEDVDFARFAPGDSSQKKQGIYDKALNMIRNLSFILILCLSASAICAQPTAKMQQAYEAYTANNYQQAIADYESILSEGYQSATLYYNLGNCYYRQMEMGRAILNYERALTLNPSDKEARENLDLCNSKIQDKISSLPHFFLTRWFQTIQHWFTPTGWLIAILLFTALLCGIVVVFVLSKDYKTRKIMLASSLVAFILLIFSITSSISSIHNRNSHNHAIVMIPAAAVKSSPENSSVDKFLLHEGTKVTIEESVGDWYKIALADGNKGWIYNSDVEKI